MVVVGSGGSATVQIRSETLTNEETEQLRTALFDAFQPKGGDGQPSKQAISDSAVSETWGGQITKKALIALAGVPGARRPSTSPCATSGTWRCRRWRRWSST